MSWSGAPKLAGGSVRPKPCVAEFKTLLNRPEILNRIGDNVLVFDFIRAEVAQLIFEGTRALGQGELSSAIPPRCRRSRRLLALRIRS